MPNKDLRDEDRVETTHRLTVWLSILYSFRWLQCVN